MEFVQLVILGICLCLCLIIANPSIAAGILFLGFAISIGLSFYKKRKMNKEVDHLITYLLLVQDKMQLPVLEESKEGRFAILQSEIYKVVSILRQSYSNEAAEKQYIVNMLSDISHQIKTPITAIAVMTDLLEQPEISDEKRLEYVAKIDSQVNKITWLVKNILILAQLEANVIVLKKDTVKLKDFMSQISDTFGIMAEVKDVELTVAVPEDISVQCDSHWTLEAISNIVKNCIEHTDCGGKVEIHVMQDNIATHITIKDNGEGIAPEHLPHIFERFYKSSQNSESVGIGLAMAKQIIISQEGTISVDSELGKGSEFYIKLYR